MRIALAIVFILAGSSAVWAAGIESCEKIKDADAYNSCLASFGPTAGEHAVTRAPPSESVSEAPRRRGRKPAAAPRHAAKRPATGRVRITIYPGQ